MPISLSESLEDAIFDRPTLSKKPPASVRTHRHSVSSTSRFFSVSKLSFRDATRCSRLSLLSASSSISEAEGAASISVNSCRGLIGIDSFSI
jgi:hypothetical protein